MLLELVEGVDVRVRRAEKNIPARADLEEFFAMWEGLYELPVEMKLADFLTFAVERITSSEQGRHDPQYYLTAADIFCSLTTLEDTGREPAFRNFVRKLMQIEAAGHGIEIPHLRQSLIPVPETATPPPPP